MDVLSLIMVNAFNINDAKGKKVFIKVRDNFGDDVFAEGSSYVIARPEFSASEFLNCH